MKKSIITLLIFCILFLTNCEKYVAGTNVTLSGKYLITRVTIKSVDQNVTGDSVYRSGDVFIDNSPSTPKPFDSISVGQTFIHFDYMLINLRYIGVNPTGQDIWDTRYQTYYRILGNNQFQEGYLQFTYNDAAKTRTTQTCTFQITEDKLESLELVSSGKWPSYKFGEKKIMIMNLVRVGP